jgi:hypothetical protein
MSRYFNEGFDAMGGEALEHANKPHKYIDRVRTKSGKWRYIYKRSDIPELYNKTTRKLAEDARKANKDYMRARRDIAINEVKNDVKVIPKRQRATNRIVNAGLDQYSRAKADEADKYIKIRDKELKRLTKKYKKKHPIKSKFVDFADRKRPY